MAVRNPFERVLNTDTADTDIPRQPPRDMMVDAFLSEIMDRLSRGYLPGIRPDMYGRHREHNGFPVGPGLRNTHHTFDAISQHPIRMNPFDLGSRGQATYGRPALRQPSSYAGDPVDPFDPMGGFDPDTQFMLDAGLGAGVDGYEQPMSPFELPPQPRLPSMAQYSPDPGLSALRNAIRPGYAELSTFGYSEPNTDPYAENLTALLRRLVRQA